jgi:hypothetical protein
VEKVSDVVMPFLWVEEVNSFSPCFPIHVNVMHVVMMHHEDDDEKTG